MSDTSRFWLNLLLGAVAVYVVFHVLVFVLHVVMSVVLPLAVLSLIGYVVYSLVHRSALGGGNRRILP